MDLTGEYTIPASREAVWAGLNDPEVLKVCIPGCDEMEKTSDTEFKANITAKIGAVRAKLKGEVTLSDIDAPNSYTISGSGKGGLAGFAKGGAKVSLRDGPDGSTILTYHAEADLGGNWPLLVRALYKASPRKWPMIFCKFARVVSGQADETKPKGTVISPSETSAPGTVYAAPGQSDWLKIALVNAAISTLAVAVAVALVSN